MNIITINGKNHQLAATWNELTTQQQITCYQIIMQDTLAEFTDDETLPYKRLAMTKYLLGFSEQFLEKWEADCIQAEEGNKESGNLIFLSELNTIVEKVTTFSFESIPESNSEDNPKPETRNSQLALTLTKCPFPRLGAKSRKRYYAPKNELSNISLYELSLSFTYFEAYLESKEEEQLHNLLAVLYRPGKPANKKMKASGYHGDRRLPLLHHESTIKKRAEKMRLLPLPAKQIIVFWFACCRHQIINAYKNIFSSPENGVEKIGNDYGWGALLMELSGGIVHLDKISKQPYSNGLTYLSYLEDKRKVQERRMALKKR